MIIQNEADKCAETNANWLARVCLNIHYITTRILLYDNGSSTHELTHGHHPPFPP